MITLRDQRESGQLFDELERIIRDQDETIKTLHKNISLYATEIVKINRSVGAALAVLQTG
jgi:hypothetical protein